MPDIRPSAGARPETLGIAGRYLAEARLLTIGSVIANFAASSTLDSITAVLPPTDSTTSRATSPASIVVVTGPVA